jgi:hypothetical protein
MISRHSSKKYHSFRPTHSSISTSAATMQPKAIRNIVVRDIRRVRTSGARERRSCSVMVARRYRYRPVQRAILNRNNSITLRSITVGRNTFERPARRGPPLGRDVADLPAGVPSAQRHLEGEEHVAGANRQLLPTLSTMTKIPQ